MKLAGFFGMSASDKAGLNPGPDTGVVCMFPRLGSREPHRLVGSTQGRNHRDTAPAFQRASIISHEGGMGGRCPCTMTLPRFWRPVTNQKRGRDRLMDHSSATLPMVFTSWRCAFALRRSEEPTSELQSLMRISYAVFCLKKIKYITQAATHQLTK